MWWMQWCFRWAMSRSGDFTEPHWEGTTGRKQGDPSTREGWPKAWETLVKAAVEQASSTRSTELEIKHSQRARGAAAKSDTSAQNPYFLLANLRLWHLCIIVSFCKISPPDILCRIDAEDWCRTDGESRCDIQFCHFSLHRVGQTNTLTASRPLSMVPEYFIS